MTVDEIKEKIEREYGWWVNVHDMGLSYPSFGTDKTPYHLYGCILRSFPHSISCGGAYRTELKAAQEALEFCKKEITKKEEKLNGIIP